MPRPAAEVRRVIKAYDVRGRVPDQLNEDIAWRIGRAFAEVIRPRKVVLGPVACAPRAIMASSRRPSRMR